MMPLHCYIPLKEALEKNLLLFILYPSNTLFCELCLTLTDGKAMEFENLKNLTSHIKKCKKIKLTRENFKQGIFLTGKLPLIRKSTYLSLNNNINNSDLTKPWHLRSSKT